MTLVAVCYSFLNATQVKCSTFFTAGFVFLCSPDNFFHLVCSLDNRHRTHHKQEYDHDMVLLQIRFFAIQKLVKFNLFACRFCSFFTTYFCFSKNGRAVRLTSDVICIIPFVIAYRSISSKKHSCNAFALKVCVNEHRVQIALRRNG